MTDNHDDHDEVDDVVLTKAEYKALLIRLARMERNYELLTNNNNGGGGANEEEGVGVGGGGGGEEEEAEQEDEAANKTKKPTLNDKIKEKIQEQYKVHATGIVSQVSSFDLLSKFTLHTAAFIAIISVLCKLAFAIVFTHFHTSSCIPTKTILAGDWDNDTYTNLFNAGNRQHLCNSYFLDEFQFAVGNQHFREEYDQDFAYKDANIDLSNYEYDFVWAGWEGILKAKEGMGWRNDYNDPDDLFDLNETTWFRMVKKDQENHFGDACAEQCHWVDSPAGFLAHNAQTKQWDCMCFGWLDLDDACLADYTNASSGGMCFAESLSPDSATYFENSYFLWNDTYYHIQPFLFFSTVDLKLIDDCNETELEDLCLPPEQVLNPQKGGPILRKGAYLPDDPTNPDGVYWESCTLAGFSCDDYQHNQCEQYGIACGEQIGSHEIPCSGLVSITYITCPAVMTTLGSSLAYLSYLELFVVTILVCLFLLHRGENPWEVLKANMIQLGRVAATKAVTDFVQKEVSMVQQEGSKLFNEAGSKMFGDENFNHLKIINADLKNHKGTAGTWGPAAIANPIDATEVETTHHSTSLHVSQPGPLMLADLDMSLEEEDPGDVEVDC